MTDSSSSSDDEEKAKLQSAAWPAHTWSGKSAEMVTGAALKQSLRNADDCEEQRDYRNIDTTPEQKSFVAKKLAVWLDSSIKEVDIGTRGPVTSRTVQNDPDDDFQLFSTSKPGLPDEKLPPAKKQQRPPSSSDSDSSEERARFSSAAISCEQILQRSWPELSQDQQVITNLSPTNNLASRMSDDGATGQVVRDQGRNLDCEKSKSKCPENVSGGELEDQCRKNKKRKKKRGKRKVEVNCESLELITEGGRKDAIKVGKQTIENLKVGSENGNKSFMEPSKQMVKKKKKKKGKSGAAVSEKSNPESRFELSAR